WKTIRRNVTAGRGTEVRRGFTSRGLRAIRRMNGERNELAGEPQSQAMDTIVLQFAIFGLMTFLSNVYDWIGGPAMATLILAGFFAYVLREDVAAKLKARRESWYFRDPRR
ncbi:MAG: hypothetical protein ACREYF_16190, partial [Gammaproteobacteria bacterium]